MTPSKPTPKTSYVTVRYEQHARGRIAFVSIDNPKKLNSLSSEVMGQFTDLFHGLAADLALRAVVLDWRRRQGLLHRRSFNIDEMAALPSPEAARAFILKVHACSKAIRDTPSPGDRRRQRLVPGRGP